MSIYRKIIFLLLILCLTVFIFRYRKVIFKDQGHDQKISRQFLENKNLTPSEETPPWCSFSLSRHCPSSRNFLKITCQNPQADCFAQSQLLPITPNQKKSSLSAEIQTINLNGNPYLKMIFFNTEKQEIQVFKSSSFAPQALAIDNLYQFKTEPIIPPLAVWVKIQIGLNGSGSVWFGNLNWQNSPSGENLFPYPSFTTDDQNNLVGWELKNNAQI